MDAARSDGQIRQQLDDIVLRSKKVILDFYVMRRGSSFGLVHASAMLRIDNPGVGMIPGHHVEIAEIFNGIIIRNEHIACNLTALIYGYTAMPAYIYLFFRFENIDIASLLKRLQDPVNTFGIAVCQEILETNCVGRIVKYKRFITNMTTCPRRDAAERKDDN